MGLGNWPERPCPLCGRDIPTFRDPLLTDDADGAWDAATETVHHYATGCLRLCHHAGGDKAISGWACSGSGAIVGQPLTSHNA